MTTVRAAISWSAGKDSCLALLHARETGWQVDDFFTMCESNGDSKSHALPPDLIAAQVAALGGIWHQVCVPEGEANAYARCLDEVLCQLKVHGCTHIVFGDIDLAAHRDWLVPRCAALGLEAAFPLWGLSRTALAEEIVRRGVRARLVCVDAGRLDPAFCGRDYDARLLAELPAGVCPCGEDGEFHTFVLGAPGMAPLAVENGPVERVASRPPFLPTEFVFQRLRRTG